jgi:hypothetical protein
MAITSLMKQAPFLKCHIKQLLSMTFRTNKLERLSLARKFGLVFYVSKAVAYS